MKARFALLLLALTCGGRIAAAEIAKIPLPLNLPAPTLKGTPGDLPSGPNIEPLPGKPRTPFMVAPGTTNVAFGKAVSSSIRPFSGELTQLTDGLKEAYDHDAVEFKRGSQWVQLDLGTSYEIQAIVLWHDHRYIQAMHDVIVQVSNDPEFKSNVTTLFNNDMDNSSHQGVGADREYFETAEGKLLDTKGVKARYVRSCAMGSSSGSLNCWQELEVYALPVP